MSFARLPCEKVLSALMDFAQTRFNLGASEVLVLKDTKIHYGHAIRMIRKMIMANTVVLRDQQLVCHTTKSVS